MMRTKLIIGISLLIIVAVSIGGLILLNKPTIVKPDNPKFCETADDCVTSCGEKTGRGSCYNRAYVTPNNPPDNTCCSCEDCRPCMTCECIDNVCASKRTSGDCC